MRDLGCPVEGRVPSMEEAEAVIDPYFTVIQKIFMEGGAEVRKVRLELARWAHDTPRHFAATEDTGRVIIVSPEFAMLPEETIAAIISHEFGHVVDFLYPGRYVLIDDGELVEMPVVPEGALISDKAEQAHVARARAWRRRSKDSVERTADAIAELFTGRTIGYCGPCELQCFDRGRRPRRLGLR